MDDKQHAAMEAANPYRIKPGCVGFPEDAFYIDVFEEGYTAAMHAHDAEKCDKLAGAVELIQYLDNIAGGTFRMCMSDDTEARWEAIVQIAREVKG